MTPRHTPSTILKHFSFEHLPPHLQRVSMAFAGLALEIDRRGQGPETSTALRKLLEAKDAAVRAAIHERPEGA